MTLHISRWKPGTALAFLVRIIHLTQPKSKAAHFLWLHMTFGLGDRGLAETGSIILVMSYLVRGAKKIAVNSQLLELFVQHALLWSV